MPDASLDGPQMAIEEAVLPAAAPRGQALFKRERRNDEVANQFTRFLTRLCFHTAAKCSM